MLKEAIQMIGAALLILLGARIEDPFVAWGEENEQ